MKDPATLSHAKLAEIVRDLQDSLYLDGNSYSDEKDWSGSDVCDQAAWMLNKHGLRPTTDGEPREPAGDQVVTLRVTSPEVEDATHEDVVRTIEKLIAIGQADASDSMETREGTMDLDWELAITMDIEVSNN